MPKYTVHIDDNYHFGDESERYTHGKYGTWEKAVAAAKKIVDEFLLEYVDKVKSAEDLLAGYKQYGEDLSIEPTEEGKQFSAWGYAAHRCRELFENRAEGSTS